MKSLRIALALWATCVAGCGKSGNSTTAPTNDSSLSFFVTST